MIFLGADHRGFALKEKLKSFFLKKGYEFEDFGNSSLNPQDDYTDFAARVAEEVRKDPEHRGILLCGSGAGVDIVANKFDGVRAMSPSSVDEIKAGRNDDDVNVVALAADFIHEDEAEAIVQAFLETPFAGEERFKRRLEKIQEIEETN